VYRHDPATGGWRPGFADYLHTSYKNATAFSPSDTMPLTAIAKLLMAIQSSIADHDPARRRSRGQRAGRVDDRGTDVRGRARGAR
jgi:hypothetical protein